MTGWRSARTESTAFADATNGNQWIRVDPERSTRGRNGATIAHGFLRLSLWPDLFAFMVSVRAFGGRSTAARTVADSHLQCWLVPCSPAVKILAVDDVSGGVQATYQFVVEAGGVAGPSCVGDVLIRYLQPT